MRLVKIFNGRENDSKSLEASINQWITNEAIEVVSITGNIAPQSPHSYATKQPIPSDVLVIVVYESATVPVSENLEEIAF